MKLRPYRLSQIDLGDFTVAGYSVAGEETAILVPELDATFDIGKCPREALTINHVLLSHGHTDHFAGLPYYFSQRDFQGIAGGTALVPKTLVAPLETLLSAWGRIDGRVPPHRLVGMVPGDDFQIRRGLHVRAFATNHGPASLGYSIVDIRQKLQEQYLGLSGPQIVALKEAGEAITRQVEVSQIAYLGDTAKSNYSDNPLVASARVLLIECTFFDPDHVSRARAGKHLHVFDLPEVLEGMDNERIIVVHVTRRTNMAVARKLLKKRLPKEIQDKLTFLMSRQHVDEE